MRNAVSAACRGSADFLIAIEFAEDCMFSEPLNSVNGLFNAPGLELEFMAVGVLAVGVVCYMVRVAWIALSHARRLELEAMKTMVPLEVHAYSGPYCAG